MTSEAVHRIIEHHAAARGDLVAIADRERSCSYRQLNYGANALARHFIARGFRRSGHACVRMPRGIDGATILLAILKAGGSYTWSDPETGGLSTSLDPLGVSIAIGVDGPETRYLYLDVTPVLAAPVSSCPNLPIMTRHTDVACILQTDGAPDVLVPHATITALRSRAVTHPTRWTSEPGAFDLWMALMAGTTALVEGQEGQTAAIAAA